MPRKKHSKVDPFVGKLKSGPWSSDAREWHQVEERAAKRRRGSPRGSEFRDVAASARDVARWERWERRRAEREDRRSAAAAVYGDEITARAAAARLNRLRMRLAAIRGWAAGRQMRCPVCMELRLGPRQWVVERRQRGWGLVPAMCVSCWRLVRSNRRPRRVLVTRRARDAIAAARRSVGLTQARFARACGWSQVQQSRVESSRGPRVSWRTISRVARVLEDLGALPRWLEVIARLNRDGHFFSPEEEIEDFSD